MGAQKFVSKTDISIGEVGSRKVPYLMRNSAIEVDMGVVI
jgi:hypothetical protein